MKHVIILLIAALVSFGSPAYSTATHNVNYELVQKKKTVKVKGYTKKNGTYVKPHYRSKPTKKRK